MEDTDGAADAVGMPKRVSIAYLAKVAAWSELPLAQVMTMRGERLRSSAPMRFRSPAAASWRATASAAWDASRNMFVDCSVRLT